MATQSASLSSTEAVIQQHLAAFSSGVDAILADYTDSSVVFTQQGTFSGLEAIRAFFDGMLSNSPPDLLKAFAVVRLETSGSFGYLVWKAEPYIPLATDTFVVRNGKMVAQSFTAFGPGVTTYRRQLADGPRLGEISTPYDRSLAVGVVGDVPPDPNPCMATALHNGLLQLTCG
jgi:hypothetical protein